MNDIQKLTAWFRSQLGTRETGENNVIYNTHFYGREVNGGQYPWCCAFIWDGFRECGLSSLFCGGAKTAYCPYVVSYARSANQWVTSGYKKGDILLYDWGYDGVADHIGFCISASGSYATAIEGNVNGGVAEVQRSNESILGAFRPKYDITDNSTSEDEKGESGELPLLKKGDVSGAVLSVQVLLIHKWSVSCGVCGADGEFGNDTEQAVLRFQRDHGLERDGVVGRETWGTLIR